MRRLRSIITALALGAASSALAQGGAPPPAALPSTVAPGSASGVNNSVSPGPALKGPASTDAAADADLRPAQGVGADAAVSHPAGSVRGTAATAIPTGQDAGMRGGQDAAVTDLGTAPTAYPVCRTRGQDRCRVR